MTVIRHFFGSGAMHGDDKREIDALARSHANAIEALPIRWGFGSPENVVLGNVGWLYLRLDGGAGTCLYVKESGTATTTGWVSK